MTMQIQTPDGVAESYVARPQQADRPVPGVLFFVDAIGLRPVTRAMADRIASWGYVVLAPHVFYRDGGADELAPDGPLNDDEARTEYFRTAMPRVHALTPEKSGPDTGAYLEALLGLDGVSSPVGVVGYCMGARLAVRAACDHPEIVAACAGFHGGGLATDDEASPHRGLSRARAEFVFGHADGDHSMPPEQIDRLGRALDAAGLRADLNEAYPGAAHGFTMSDTAVYDESATERSFDDMRTLFDRVLRA